MGGLPGAWSTVDTAITDEDWQVKEAKNSGGTIIGKYATGDTAVAVLTQLSTLQNYRGGLASKKTLSEVLGYSKEDIRCPSELKTALENELTAGEFPIAGVFVLIDQGESIIAVFYIDQYTTP
jgi:hypothetical protein